MTLTRSRFVRVVRGLDVLNQSESIKLISPTYSVDRALLTFDNVRGHGRIMSASGREVLNVPDIDGPSGLPVRPRRGSKGSTVLDAGRGPPRPAIPQVTGRLCCWQAQDSNLG